MIQDDKNLSPRDKKTIINERFLSAIEMLIKSGLAKSVSHIAEKTGYDSTNASRYKKGTGFVGTDDIYSVVNEFNLNPSYLFLKDGPEQESLIMERSVHIAGNVGNNNAITNEHNSNKPTINVHGTVGNLNVVHTLENLIADVEPELKKQLLNTLSLVNKEMALIKKTADQAESALVDKKEELVDTKRNLIEVKGLLKKKNVQLSEKDAQLKESNDLLIKAKDEMLDLQKKVNEIQHQYLEMVKRTEKVVLDLAESVTKNNTKSNT